MEQKSPEDSVTGVSRSGRVRKKSRKLTDFTNDDEIKVTKKHFKDKQDLSHYSTNVSGYSDLQEPESMSASYSTSGLLKPDDIGFSDEDGNEPTGKELPMTPVVPKRSIYMTEKSSKKQKLMKDGTIVLSKAQRKDKGKPRFTAYMLWSKEARQQIMSSNPEIDFASASKRLGEMWANVPSNQKYQWKKKAKRLQTKIKKNTAKALAAEQAAARSGGIKPMSASIARRAAKRIESENQLQQQKKAAPATKREVRQVAANETTKVSKQAILKPVDIAAHLKLLGDSLETIGQRLKEHDGQITVSGSLSVLLDTLLCSLGPLVSLTYYIPNLGDRLECLKPSTTATLDNIAYLMPGL